MALISPPVVPGVRNVLLALTEPGDVALAPYALALATGLDRSRWFPTLYVGADVRDDPVMVPLLDAARRAGTPVMTARASPPVTCRATLRAMADAHYFLRSSHVHVLHILGGEGGGAYSLTAAAFLRRRVPAVQTPASLDPSTSEPSTGRRPKRAYLLASSKAADAPVAAMRAYEAALCGRSS